MHLIYSLHTDLEINLVRERDPEVNGIELSRLDEGAVAFGHVQIMKAGMFFVINSTHFTIKWDGATRIYITIHSQWKGKMQGICGNFNMDASDDLM
jgi:hypothetical protein